MLGIRMFTDVLLFNNIDERVFEHHWRRKNQVQNHLPGRSVCRKVLHHRKIHQRQILRRRQCKSMSIQSTVGIDFHIKNLTRNGHQYRIQLWDTAGSERFRSLIPNYMKDANCAVMVYDVTRKATFNNLKTWNDLFEEHMIPDAVKVVVGNKIDLPDRQVTKKEGEL